MVKESESPPTRRHKENSIGIINRLRGVVVPLINYKNFYDRERFSLRFTLLYMEAILRSA
jgi:hypothetical protein